MKAELIICGLTALTLITGTQAQSRAGNAIPVTPENFIRAETDRLFRQDPPNRSCNNLFNLSVDVRSELRPK